MLHQFHFRSLAIGVVAATMLLCTMGADTQHRRQYDAAAVMGGMGLQIVDHATNSLFSYRRVKSGENVTYVLIESVDLSACGNHEISAKTFHKTKQN